ncbi:hypothetical protein [Runella sp.]|uniref:hypothetical protein n=1 Tax=Runella sp. TaxID=1960881 RepID=UPI003D0B509C
MKKAFLFISFLLLTKENSFAQSILRGWHSWVWADSNVIVRGGANKYLDNSYASGGIYLTPKALCLYQKN